MVNLFEVRQLHYLEIYSAETRLLVPILKLEEKKSAGTSLSTYCETLLNNLVLI